MPEKLVPFLMKQPHVTFATGTMGQPLGGFDVLTGIDPAQFNRLSGGFRFLKGGPFQNDDDIIVDKYYARETKLNVGNTIALANHTWRVSGIFESGKLSHICARLSVLQALTENLGRLSQIYLKVDEPARAAGYRRPVAGQNAGVIQSTQWSDHLTYMSERCALIAHLRTCRPDLE